MRLKELVKNIYFQDEWRGANTSFIVTPEGIVLIDVPPDIDKARIWAEAIKKKGNIRYIINTEIHHDHWITDSVFGDQIIAHEASYEVMKIMDHKFIRERANLIYAEPFDFPESFELRLPNMIISQNLTLHLGGYTIQILWTPGHTLGQLAVYVPEEKILFPADTLINKVRTPYHDSLTDERWLNSLDTLQKLDIRYIVPGHGDVLTGKEYIETTRTVVKGFLQAVKEGKTNDKGVRLSEEENRKFDPFYDTLPRAQKPGGVTLFNSKESQRSGAHGKIDRR